MLACEIKGSHSSEDADHSLLECDPVTLKMGAVCFSETLVTPCNILQGITTQKISFASGSMHCSYFQGFIIDVILFI